VPQLVFSPGPKSNWAWLCKLGRGAHPSDRVAPRSGKLLAARLLLLEILGARFEDALEARRHGRKSRLQRHDDIGVVLLCLARPRGIVQLVLLQPRNLLVKIVDVLLNDVRKLLDLNWPVVKQRSLLRHCNVDRGVSWQLS
jgi:hypothetical protein